MLKNNRLLKNNNLLEWPVKSYGNLQAKNDGNYNLSFRGKLNVKRKKI